MMDVMRHSIPSHIFSQKSVVQNFDRAQHYMYVGDKPDEERQRPLIIFVHGSPGDWRSFVQYLSDHDLLERANMIAVDRLGFGDSQAGRFEPSLGIQARMLNEIVEKHRAKSSRIILIGHGVGGTLLARYAMDFPHSVDYLILSAPPVDPKIHTPRWYQKLSASKLVRFLLPPALKVSGDEMALLEDQLIAMAPDWQKIEVPVLVMHGEKDWLVPPAHLKFIEKNCPDAEIIRLEKQGHFIPWEEYGLVKRTLLRLVE